MKACYAHQMREMYSRAVSEAKIPGVILMENAAIACVDELFNTFSDMMSKTVAVFCGKGNNGGDGLAIARHLYNRGVDVAVYYVCGVDYAGDALTNYEITESLDIHTEIIEDAEGYDFVVRAYDIVVDAIFGTGIRGAIRGVAAEIIGVINQDAKYVLSVDISSGIDSDSGEVCGICIKADKTVTFAAYKVGMFMYPGADYTGEIVVADISMPKYISNDDRYGINVTDAEFVRNIFPKRKNNSHKGDYGKLLIIAGSAGMSGAAYLSSQAAMLSGCGLVTLAVPDCINSALESKTTEVMTLPLPSSEGHLSFTATDKILEKISSFDAILIGPGLGTSDDILLILEAVLRNSSVPVIIDADAINSISKNTDLIKKCSCDLLFTPHAMEMSRLTGLEISYIEENRLDVCSEFSEEYGATVILKGHHTIVTSSDAVQYINITGNPGLAGGGSGDVLAGVTAALAARGISVGEAAAAAVYIHGLAGDIAAEKYGMESTSAQKVLDMLPVAIYRKLQID